MTTQWRIIIWSEDLSFRLFSSLEGSWTFTAWGNIILHKFFYVLPGWKLQNNGATSLTLPVGNEAARLLSSGRLEKLYLQKYFVLAKVV